MMDDAAAIKLVEDLSEACHRGEYDRFPEFLTDELGCLVDGSDRLHGRAPP